MHMRRKPLQNRHKFIRRRIRRRFFAVAALIASLPFVFLFCYILSREAWTLFDPDKIFDTDQTLLVTDRNGTVISRLYAEENRTDISIETLPSHTVSAFIAAEDARFYSHSGVDLIRICGAALADLKAGAFVEGASTITQQLIKLTHLTDEKTVTRKLDEAILAHRLEQEYSKDEILEAYLNYVYFGGGYYGIEAAAQGYFGIPSSELSLSQSALLAGILKSPSRFAPHLRPEASVGRRGVILDLMANYGMISKEQAELAKAEPLLLSDDTVKNARGYYVDLALNEACKTLGCSMDTLLRSGMTLHTAMDPELQALTEAAFSIDAYFPHCNNKSSEGACVFIDSKTGGVSAIVGGRDSETALALNRATDIRRQPGSAIKPILVYAPALEAGYTASSMLLDDAIAFSDYRPRNASGSYRGWVTMREAVTRSLNLPAVSLFDSLGVERCKAFAETLGITFDERDTRLALALGGFTYGVSPYRLAAAYAAFSNGGVYTEPYVLSEISDKDDAALYVAERTERRVMRASTAFLLTDMLRSVVKDGTAKRLSHLNFDLAAKTGTVGDTLSNRDIWLACYNADFACVVWMGFDDASEGNALPADSGGGTYPAELLQYILKNYYRDRQAPTFPVPHDVVRVQLDAYTLRQEHTARLASLLTPQEETALEYFARGTEPIELSEFWQTPSAPDDLAVWEENGSVIITFSAPSSEMQYRLYREDISGFTVLLETFENVCFPVRYVDSNARSARCYYVVPVHPLLKNQGVPLCGIPSLKVYRQSSH